MTGNTISTRIGIGLVQINGDLFHPVPPGKGLLGLVNRCVKHSKA